MISIIIPAFNEERHIGNLLKSLAEQDFDEEIEIVVADANSTDKTESVAKKYQDAFDRLLIVQGGIPAVSRNNGAKASSGDPIFFIDADLVMTQKSFLAEAVHYFRKNNLAIATVYLKPRSRKLVDRIIVAAYNGLLNIAKYVRPMGSMCIIASREAFNKSGGYPENVVMAEDHDFILNASQYGSYDIIPLYIYFSVRRMEKEGRLGLLIIYIKASFHRVFFGPITKFDYEFTYSEEEDDPEKYPLR